ncbi:hypothetical protein MoryE10_00530 [Methylogaea oryzae]|uniref:DUF4365 domain-containing protein n=2 Tax=Methylogaea oryzae TaxID=1295382 RepID=A0A8D4VMU1_9GAMM|nr:hypothetical protein MoryE10_00530 [Methylogaea oryzae]
MDGHVTGQLLAVQIKYGKSFFQEKNRWGYIYRGEQKHFNYLANYPIPVLIVLCHPESKECYWVRFLPQETQPAGDNWKITVFFENILRESKAKIEALLPPLMDHREALEAYWAVNNLLAESDYLHFIIDRPEVESKDITRTREFFDRLRVTRELALENQGKVELSFFGYENDPRELFEIPVVREYISILSPALPELFFFVRTQQPTSTLKTFALCQTNVSWVDGRSTRLVAKQIVYDTDKVVDFLQLGYSGLNEMTEWLALPLEENIRISADVAHCLGIRAETDVA